MSDTIVTVFVALFSGGTVAAIVQGIVSHKRGVRDTDVEREQTAFEQMKVILAEHQGSIASLRKEISELQSARSEDTQRLNDLSEENRMYRWTMIGVTDRLRQKPKGTVDDVLEYIHGRLPALRKDKE